MRRIVCLLAVAAAACTDRASDPAPAPTPSPTATASASATATSSSGARAVSEETDDFLFEYAYPKEAGGIPELAALLDRRLAGTRARLAEESAAARREARADGFPYNKQSVTVAWKVVANLPQWLSLSSEVASYSGGAHGNYGFDSLVWDKDKARALEAIALFRSPAALDAALGEGLCQALDAERAKRRGRPVPEDSDDQFDQCVGVDEATVLVGSRGGRRFDRLSLQLGPYVAGPYAEGAYAFDFPVDAKILDAVKPEFRDAFAARN